MVLRSVRLVRAALVAALVVAMATPAIAAPTVNTRLGDTRVTLSPQDALASVLGTDWERIHWYPTAAERDRALRDMASEHLYSRKGDRPTLRYEPIDP